MAKRAWALQTALALAAALLIALFCRVTVVPDAAPSGEVDASGNAIEAVELSVAERYCAEHWEAKVLAAIDERAIDPAAFAEGLRGDLDALGAVHAARANETSPWSFCLSGEAVVLGVENPDAKTKTRLILDAAPYDGQADMLLQVSSVIKTNAVRDAVGFLKLDDFANQVEFAELTKAFNARVQKDVLSGLDPQSLVGKKIRFGGCVSVQKPGDEALIVPVRIEVEAA